MSDARELSGRLAADGHNRWRIAAELDVSPSTISRWLDPGKAEKQRRQSREYKARQSGLCIDCGAITRYNGRTVRGASDRCFRCACARNGEALRGSGPTQLRLLAEIRPERRRSEIAAAAGVPPQSLGSHFDRLLRYGLIERVARGRYRRKENAQCSLI